jgi:hypothetical protein
MDLLVFMGFLNFLNKNGKSGRIVEDPAPNCGLVISEA